MAQDASSKTAQELESITGVPIDRLKRAVKDGFVPAPKSGRHALAPTLVGLLKFLNKLLAEASELPVYDSMAQCAARTGIPMAVLKRLKKAGSKAFKWNRVALGPLLADLFAGGDEDKNWRGHFDKYHALREELRHSHEAGQTLKKEEVAFAMAKGISAVFNQLDRAANIEWPPALKGLDEHGCQSVLVKGISKIKHGLHEEWSKFAGNGNGK